MRPTKSLPPRRSRNAGKVAVRPTGELTDEGKVSTLTKPVLCNSPPPHQSSTPCGLDASFSTQGRSLRLRGAFHSSLFVVWKIPSVTSGLAASSSSIAVSRVRYCLPFPKGRWIFDQREKRRKGRTSGRRLFYSQPLHLPSCHVIMKYIKCRKARRNHNGKEGYDR